MEKFIDWLKANGYQYKDEDIYLEACTHSSYANEHHREMGDNERLEFMGDSVLQIWSATQLFLMEPKMREGQMTTLRAQTVCESKTRGRQREAQRLTALCSAARRYMKPTATASASLWRI